MSNRKNCKRIGSAYFDAVSTGQARVRVCKDCFGSRSVPDDGAVSHSDYQPCPSCVIDAGNTFVVWE